MKILSGETLLSGGEGAADGDDESQFTTFNQVLGGGVGVQGESRQPTYPHSR